MCEDCGAGCNGTRANRRQHALEVRTFWRPRAALGSALAVNTVNEVRPRSMEDVGAFRAISPCYRSHHQVRFRSASMTGILPPTLVSEGRAKRVQARLYARLALRRNPQWQMRALEVDFECTDVPKTHKTNHRYCGPLFLSSALNEPSDAVASACTRWENGPKVNFFLRL